VIAGKVQTIPKVTIFIKYAEIVIFGKNIIISYFKAQQLLSSSR